MPKQVATLLTIFKEMWQNVNNFLLILPKILKESWFSGFIFNEDENPNFILNGRYQSLQAPQAHSFWWSPTVISRNLSSEGSESGDKHPLTHDDV